MTQTVFTHANHSLEFSFPSIVSSAPGFVRNYMRFYTSSVICSSFTKCSVSDESNSHRSVVPLALRSNSQRGQPCSWINVWVKNGHVLSRRVCEEAALLAAGSWGWQPALPSTGTGEPFGTSRPEGHAAAFPSLLSLDASQLSVLHACRHRSAHCASSDRHHDLAGLWKSFHGGCG